MRPIPPSASPSASSDAGCAPPDSTSDGLPLATPLADAPPPPHGGEAVQRSHVDAASALAHVQALYADGVARLHDALREIIAHGPGTQRVRAFYPRVRLVVDSPPRVHMLADSTPSYGFVSAPGVFEATLTRPDLYADYYLEQFELLLRNHRVPLLVGPSEVPIALPFTFDEHTRFEAELDGAARRELLGCFDMPDLGAMDDGIANGTFVPAPGQARPLALFTAPRVDYSLQRLRHYTGTSAGHFQNFVLFTNYGFYVDEFVAMAREMMRTPQADAQDYCALVEPGNVVTRRAGVAGSDADAGQPPQRMPQMPAYHLVRPDRSGITLVNIGVGPSNARTITDHVAVLRPHTWLMLGHCAGLRSTQQLGDYVLAHGYVREDHVLDEDLPPWVPIPALAEVQVALQQAVAEVTRLQGPELKRVMRTGTVASTDNRHWELQPFGGPLSTPRLRFSQSRAIALDMESATIAANGFRLRVPYGTLLCVSDKPLHGDLKLPGMADRFYRERVGQHLRIGLRALEILRGQRMERLHSRKLRSFDEVAFQ